MRLSPVAENQSCGRQVIHWLSGSLKKENAVLAGEMSGHLFFAERYFVYDDGIYGACKLWNSLSKQQKPLSQYLGDLPKVYNTPEIRLPCRTIKSYKLVEKIKKIVRKEAEVIDIDGVRIRFPDGWGLVRASNTSPILVMRFEARVNQCLRFIQGYMKILMRTQRKN
jgi:phosphomannomutase/phosphoglucomutase